MIAERLQKIKAARAAGRMVFTAGDVDTLLYYIESGKAADPDDIQGWVRKLVYKWHHRETRDNHDYFAHQLEEAARGRR